MSTSSLYFLAQVGKTSLIMALVGEEFPEEVSEEGTRTAPARAPSLGGTALSPVSSLDVGLSGRCSQLPGL